MDYIKLKKGMEFDKLLEENNLQKIRVGDTNIYYLKNGFFVSAMDNMIENIYFFKTKDYVEKNLITKIDFDIDEENIEKIYN